MCYFIFLISFIVTQVVSSLSFLSTLLVAWDQYLAVLRPLRYHHSPHNNN